MNSTYLTGLHEGRPMNGEQRTIPFDYAFRYNLNGVTETVHAETVTVSIEASFTALSIGYGVVPKLSPVKFGVIPKPTPPISIATKAPFLNTRFGSILAALAVALKEPLLGSQTAVVLKNGFKLNPDFAEQILTAFSGQFPPDILAEAFQAVAPPPERIQFLYALVDEGSGREFQSEPILNIAGLGASDGGRPFRYFAKPIVFAPQSTIRMQVTEVSQFTGELHVSLQGYKTLGAPGTPTGPRQVRRMVGSRR